MFISIPCPHAVPLVATLELRGHHPHTSNLWPAAWKPRAGRTYPVALLSRQPSEAVEAAVALCGGQRAAQRPPCSDGRPSVGHDSGSIYAPWAPGPCVWWPPACLSPHSLLPCVHIPGLFSPRHPQRHRPAVFRLTAEKLVCASACHTPHCALSAQRTAHTGGSQTQPGGPASQLLGQPSCFPGCLLEPRNRAWPTDVVNLAGEGKGGLTQAFNTLVLKGDHDLLREMQ